MPDRQNLHDVFLERKAESAVRGEIAVQKRLSEAEAGLVIRRWEQNNCPLWVSSRTRVSRLQQHQANQSADQVPREKINLCGNWNWRTELFKTDTHKLRKNLKNYEEFVARRQTEIDNFLRIQKLFMRHERGPTIVVSYCLKLWTYRTKRIPFLRRRIFTILRQREGLEHPTFLVHPWRFRVPEENIGAILDRRLIHGILWVLQETFLKAYRLDKDNPPAIFENSGNLASSSRGLRPAATKIYHGTRERNDTRATKLVNTHLDHTGGTYSHGGVVDSQRFSFSDMHPGKFPISMNSKSGKLTSRLKYA